MSAANLSSDEESIENFQTHALEIVETEAEPVHAVQIEALTHEELAIWLSQNQIPQHFCSLFEENYIDGKEFLELKEQDIKDIIPALGIVKRILRLIPKDAHDQVPSMNTPTATISDVLTPSNASSQEISPTSGPNSCNSSSASATSQSMSQSTVSSQLVEIPNHWRPDTTKCIKTQSLSSESRNDIVRTLVQMLMSKVGPKPTRSHCQQAARNLILKHPFMKDDIGDGYLSWVEKMVERIRNVNKADKKKLKLSNDDEDDAELPTPKRAKKAKADDLTRRYPVLTGRNKDLVDSETIKQHKMAIDEEMSKPKPRERVLLPLMKSTFTERWCFIKNEAESVKEILDTYPGLKFPTIIEQEVNLVMESTDKKAQFIKEWLKFVPAIISYGRKKSSMILKQLLKDYDSEDDAAKNITAFKVLCDVLTSKQTKCGFECLYKEYNFTHDVTQVTHPLPSPNIAAFTDESNAQYFIFVEGKILCKSTRFSDALFLMFASYYIFNLKYPMKAKNILCFLQDYIFGYADSCGRSATYLATVSDIKTHL